MNLSARNRNILIAIGAVVVISLAWYFRSIVTYLLISAVLATIGRPLVRWLKQIHIWKIRFSPSVSALITLITMWALMVVFFRFMIPLLINEFKDLASVNIDSVLAQLEEPVNSITKFFTKEPVSLTNGTIMEMAGEKLSSFFKISQVTDLLGTLAGTLGGLMIGIFSVSFITFFFLREEGMFRNALLLLSPTDYEERVSKSLDRISRLLNRYFVGLILEVVMVATLDSVGLLIVGLDFGNAVLIGFLCGLFNVIPYLGPWIGAVAGILISLAINVNFPFMSHTLPLIGFMIIVFAAVQVIDNILFQPLIYSSSVKAHPLEIFLVIMAAGSLAGVVGMILAIPVYTILRVFAAEFFSGMKLVKKLTENMDTIDKKHGK